MATSAEDSKTKTPIETLSEQLGENEQLRIQIGRRIVQGALASGEQRSIVPERAAAINMALQQPVAEGIDTTAYQGKLPGIEIRSGAGILFRQEYDGAVTTNAFQMAQQQAAELWAPQVFPEGDRLAETIAVADTPQIAVALEERPAEAQVLVPEAAAQQTGEEIALAEPVTLTGDALVENSVQMQEVSAWAKEIVAPLEASGPVAAELGTYTIEALTTGSITIFNGDDVVLKATGDQIEQSNLGAADAKALTGWLQRDGGFEMWTVPVQQAEPAAEPLRAIAIKVAQAQVQALPDNRAKSFFQKLVEDVGQQAARGLGAVRQGLESEQFKALQSNVSTGVREAPERTAEAVGKGLEKTGQWLALKSETIRDQKAARAAFNIFEEGFKRTHEKSFEHGGFKVEFEGGNRFRLSSAETGEAMMRFSANKSMVPGQSHSFSVLEKSMTREQYGALNT
ncbi:MAG: hypothetical protein WBA10_10500, partial [Elainellaceae cyanobacterium]